jgi:hypothetical protein
MHHPDTRAELNETAAPPSPRVGHSPHEPRFRKLPRCAARVRHLGGSEAPCGEPAEFEITWDDGTPPLPLCDLHARAVEAAGRA